MSTMYERDLTIHEHPVRIDVIPHLFGIFGGPFPVDNPGWFQPGKYVVRLDAEKRTARIESRV